MDLNESLHAAVAQSPPSSIDLDGLIRGELRRAGRQRWLTSAGAVVTVAAVLAVLASGVPHGGSDNNNSAGGAPPACVGPSPGGDTTIFKVSPAPSLSSLSPTRDPTIGNRHLTGCGAIERQLNNALPAAVTAAAPGAVLEPVVFNSWNPTYYTVSLHLTDKGLIGWFSLMVSSVDTPTNGQTAGCESLADPCTNMASDVFVGHTHVRAYIKLDDRNGPPPSSTLPLNQDQLNQIANWPDFVIFP